MKDSEKKMNEKEKMSIRQVSEFVGMSADAIRLYEKEGLFIPYRDPKNGYRYYEKGDIRHLVRIMHYRKAGFGLADIRRILGYNDFDDIKKEMIEQMRRESEIVLEHQIIEKKIERFLRTIDILQNGIRSCERITIPARYKIMWDMEELKHDKVKAWKRILHHPLYNFGRTCCDFSYTNHEEYNILRTGIAVDQETIESLGLPVEDTIVEYQPPIDCVCYVVANRYNEDFSWQYERVHGFARRKKIQLADYGEMYHVYDLTGNTGVKEFYEVCIPILKGEK